VVRAYVSIGSNLGEREVTCLAAVDALGRLPGAGALRRSRLYETEAWGLRDQPAFVNLVAGLDTALPPAALLAAVLEIERSLGRRREAGEPRWGPRVIDLDLLLHGGLVLHTPGLILPHPRLHERRFVLAPLAELDPALRHPVLAQTVAELLAALPPGEGGWVRPLEGAEQVEPDTHNSS
jgi:2-amino-4-hydroxy-6-hydroxymethyldihydropteridine diphosphokinase